MSGRHFIYHANSKLFKRKSNEVYDLILTCPPYFHPAKRDEDRFGVSPVTSDLDSYVESVSEILYNSYDSLLKPGGNLVMVKTDFWFKNRTYLVGFELAKALEQMGIKLYRHWVWQKANFYSPYSPSFANIFVFGDSKTSTSHNGIFNIPLETPFKDSPLFYTDIYERILEYFTVKGDTVFDPFVGTGSVIMAADILDRNATGVEISYNQIEKATRNLKSLDVTIIQDATMMQQ